MLEWIVIFPALASVICLFLKHRPDVAEKVALCASALSLALVIWVSNGFSLAEPVSAFFGQLYLDSVSLIFTGLTALVAFFVLAYSIGYMRHEVGDGAVRPGQLARYYALLCAFLATMFLASLASNLLVIWAAVEATTLASVFLISFYDKKESLEAAWKYFIICSLGITVALIGIIILGYGASSAGSVVDFSWMHFSENAARISPLFLKIAFAFIFVGFGTKMGLVPLHVWLPDAHSQAPTPVSALLSGVLLNVAFYAVLRAYQVVAKNAEAASFAAGLFVFFGLLSLVLASMRLYFQENYKRLLAYSSTENMGIVALAFGIGGPLGILAALWHVVAHSLVKPLAFFIGGLISLAYGTKEIKLIQGAAKAVPVFGLAFVLVAVGVAGSLPFGTFFSEITLLSAALGAGRPDVAFLVIGCTTIAFASFLLKSTGMALGPLPDGVKIHKSHWAMMAATGVLAVLAVVFGLLMPPSLASTVQSAVALLSGG
ncbi:hydrogenase 4 subunit F [Candidatus Micrarchaeota archaeon]|nr:hydrogenase 4 subunit F [Candidatus Micrarchaeota archaeon]